MGTVAGALKFVGFLLNCLWVIPSQSLVLLLGRGPKSYVLPQLWHRIVCLIFGLKFKVIGKVYSGGQVMFISNHLSYLDIPVIGSVVRASFVAKQDVSGWPVFGYLSTLQQTAFISRSREDAAREKYALQTMLDDGKDLIIFPEGTSTDGREVLPFKSSLFALPMELAKKQPVVIQTVTVRLENAKTQEERDLYAWHGDMEMPPHLWAVARSKGAQVTLVFHEPLNPLDFKNRKELSAACHAAVASGLKETEALANAA